MKSCGIVVEGMKKSGGDWDIQMDEEITKKVIRREEEKKRKENLKKYRIKNEKKNGVRE